LCIRRNKLEQERPTSIERSRVVVALEPRVDEADLFGSVGHDRRKPSTLEEAFLLEVYGNHLVDSRVDV